MSKHTAISWTDHTFNPWWGCSRVSDGCRFCYAETLATRWGHDVWGDASGRRFFGDKHWAEPRAWNLQAETERTPRFVFCASMADIFEEHEGLDAQRARLWDLVGATPWLVWLLLTKRPENVMDMVPGRWWPTWDGWPVNAWVGATTEHQRAADERLPVLTRIPAPVRFVSAEPLLRLVDLARWLPNAWDDRPAVSWVIAGGESGPRHRPIEADWIRSLRNQCIAADVPFHFKQWGGRTPKAGGKVLDGREWCERPDAGLVPA